MKKRKNVIIMLVMAMVLTCTACSTGTTAKEDYKQGLEALEKGNYEEAEHSLQNAVKKNKEKAEYYISYGMALIEVGKYDEAQTQFDKAILDKNNKIVRENNKQAYRGKGIAYLKEGKITDAIDQLKLSLGTKGEDALNVDIMFYLAEAYEKNNDYENATLVYNSMENIQKSGLLYVKRAKNNIALEQYEAAENDFNNAINMDKGNLFYYLEKYYVLEQAGKTKDAEKCLSEAASIEVKGAENQTYSAVIQYLQGEKEKAVETLIAQEQKNNLLACYYLGNIYVQEKEYEKAASCYESYLNSSEKNEEFSTNIYGKLAECYVQMDKKNDAVTLLENAMDAEQGTMKKTLQKTLVAVYEQNLQFKKAMKAAKTYLKSYPKDKEMKREYNFLKTRVHKVNPNENGNQTANPKATAQPNSPSLPETTDSTIQRSETMIPSSTDTANGGKPDIIQ